MRMKGKLLSFLAMAIAAAAAWPGTGEAITFSDGTFPNADWTSQVETSRSVPIASATGTQVTSGGNPGDHRQVLLQWTEVSPTTGIFAIHLKNSAVYDPTVSGAIDHIDISFDSAFFGCTAGVCPGTTLYLMALMQGDTEYVANATAALPVSATWINTALGGLDAGDFAKAGAGSGGSSPDFSATGAPITFGYWTQNSSGFTGPHNTSSGIDNWTMTVSSVVGEPAPAPIPEPSTLALLSSGLVGLGGAAWRRYRRK